MTRTLIKKARNYSFKESKRVPENRMTVINDIKIPSIPGSCYHAIICALAVHKNKLVPWNKLVELTERFIRQYGGTAGWEKFKNKNDVKTYDERIKENAHTLTRTGRDCYGYRLHERGMAIYYFKDGAQLLTGGTFKEWSGDYSVTFTDGRGLQSRYRGTTMTFREYKKFLELGYIDKSARLLNPEAIRKYRANRNRSMAVADIDEETVRVCITLGPDFNQSTAERLEAIGFITEEALDNELIGMVRREVIEELKKDKDVANVELEF